MQEQSQHSADYEPQAEPATRRLYRSVIDRKLSGVCGGVAEYLGVDSMLVRALWIGAAIMGFGLIAYIVAWLIIPENPKGVLADPGEPRRGGGQHIVGIALIIVGAILLAERSDLYWLMPWRWINWGLAFAILLVALGAVMVVRGRKESPESSDAVEFDDSPGMVISGGGETMQAKKLMRSLDERMIGGVCGGLAEYFNVDPSLIRVGWVVLSFLSGFFPGVIAYIVLMVIVPERHPDMADRSSTVEPSSSVS